MSDYEYTDPEVGPTVVFEENQITIRGTVVPAIEIIEAAFQWKNIAEQRRWNLRDNRGMLIHWNWVKGNVN